MKSTTSNRKKLYSGAIAIVLGLAILTFPPLIGTNAKADAEQLNSTSTGSLSGSVALLAPVLPASVLPVTNPILLVIPQIHVNASIAAMGLAAGDKMAVPNNFTDVGWYALGTMPGSVGNAVLGAHVDNGSYDPTVNGVFKNLNKLSAGDSVYVLDSNGKTLHFVVTGIAVYPYNTTDTDAVFGTTDQARLNLITCYGKWLASVGTYSERLVVSATLVN